MDGTRLVGDLMKKGALGFSILDRTDVRYQPDTLIIEQQSDESVVSIHDVQIVDSVKIIETDENAKKKSALNQNSEFILETDGNNKEIKLDEVNYSERNAITEENGQEFKPDAKPMFIVSNKSALTSEVLQVTHEEEGSIPNAA